MFALDILHSLVCQSFPPSLPLERRFPTLFYTSLLSCKAHSMTISLCGWRGLDGIASGAHQRTQGSCRVAWRVLSFRSREYKTVPKTQAQSLRGKRQNSINHSATWLLSAILKHQLHHFYPIFLFFHGPLFLFPSLDPSSPGPILSFLLNSSLLHSLLLFFPYTYTCVFCLHLWSLSFPEGWASSGPQQYPLSLTLLPDKLGGYHAIRRGHLGYKHPRFAIPVKSGYLQAKTSIANTVPSQILSVKTNTHIEMHYPANTSMLSHFSEKRMPNWWTILSHKTQSEIKTNEQRRAALCTTALEQHLNQLLTIREGKLGINGSCLVRK